MNAQQTSTANILVERHGRAVSLVIHRPPLNILTIEALGDLRRAVEAVMAEDGVRLVELKGAGEKAFSAGTEIREHFPERAPAMLGEFHAVVRALVYAPRPTVAVVRGHCLGAGMELALACDFVVASRDARFGQPEIMLGAFPPVAAALLPRLIPEKRALEMILTGETITAEEAERLGLVNRLAESGELDREAEKFRTMLLAQSGAVMKLARQAVRRASREGFEGALREAERLYLDELLANPDAVEGLEAFLEKRPAKWSR